MAPAKVAGVGHAHLVVPCRILLQTATQDDKGLESYSLALSRATLPSRLQRRLAGIPAPFERVEPGANPSGARCRCLSCRLHGAGVAVLDGTKSLLAVTREQQTKRNTGNLRQGTTLEHVHPSLANTRCVNPLRALAHFAVDSRLHRLLQL
eukprot:4817998-Prymnesium_polylepis.1